MFRSTIIITALALSAPCLADPADPAPRTRVVSYGDLNLASESGRATLDRRIQTAAREVCSEPGFSPQERRPRERKCQWIAIADARQQVRTVTVELAMIEPLKTR